jgi:hypothetical protein
MIRQIGCLIELRNRSEGKAGCLTWLPLSQSSRFVRGFDGADSTQQSARLRAPLGLANSLPLPGLLSGEAPREFRLPLRLEATLLRRVN